MVNAEFPTSYRTQFLSSFVYFVFISKSLSYIPYITVLIVKKGLNNEKIQEHTKTGQ